MLTGNPLYFCYQIFLILVLSDIALGGDAVSPETIMNDIGCFYYATGDLIRSHLSVSWHRVLWYSITYLNKISPNTEIQ